MTPQQKNRRTLTIMLGIAVGMVGLAYASVPLYRMFCQITGFGGTPQLALGEHGPGAVGEQNFRVFFNADTSPNLSWQFRPQQRSVTVKAGQDQLVAYWAHNLSQQPLTGTSTFNVTPEGAAQYFIKTQCFCFERQTLTAGQEMDFPVMFYIHPDILNDPNVENLREITLSYTFYPADAVPPSKALEPKRTSAY